eukprot:GHUV01035721.1.p1 GENE.GHUV01035721.1~~GHUV01035721.1.p1  ORF type:complete len:211 (+),score=81.52 GHUV01035721.1:466-1098(+)
MLHELTLNWFFPAPAGQRCVELGAGMGLVGLVLARLGAAVYLTDKPSMTVHARVNAAKNKLLAASCPVAVDTNNSRPSSNGMLAAQAAGTAAVAGLDWEDLESVTNAAAAITSQGPIDLIVATDCIYSDPNGTVPSSCGFVAAVRALAMPGHTRVLTSFEARSDDLRQALLSAAADVDGDGGCEVQRLEADVLPEAYRTQHIELYELLLR